MTELTWAADGSDASVAAHVAAIVARGPATFAMPGGATPLPIFANLAGRNLPWEQVTIWPTDERRVPATHRASNLKALQAAFGNTGARLVALSEGAMPPRFDLVWLGMGADGHVASLFPNTDPSADAAPGVIRVMPEPLPPEAPFERLTLTLAALANTAEVILVVRGDAKRTLLEAAAAGENDLPVGRLLALAPATVFWSPA